MSEMVMPYGGPSDNKFKITTYIAVGFLVVMFSFVMYALFIDRDSVALREGLKNKAIVETLILPPTFTSEENTKIVNTLTVEAKGSSPGEISPEEAQRNKDITNSLLIQ